MAKIGWIDFSRKDREMVMRVMSLIRPEGQLDELGIGRVRDRLANKLFPGISTIQTRAKYFFIVPYIIRDYLSLNLGERKKTNPEKYLNDEQHKIKNIFRQKYEGKRNTGVIGITLGEKERSVRPPSEIYWVGINRFRCMQIPNLSLSAYLRKLERAAMLEVAGKKDENDITDDPDAVMNENIGSILVPHCPSWKENIDIELTADEADFLKNTFSDHRNPYHNDTVLREVFNNDLLMEIFLQENNFQDFAKKAISVDISENLRQNLIYAHDFSYVIDGAHKLYNHMLQIRFFEEHYENTFLNNFRAWHGELRNTLIDFSGFSTEPIDYPHGFFASWWRYAKEPVLDDDVMSKMRRLIENREYMVKGKKARLRNSREANHNLEPQKWIGIGLLSYRYWNAKRIVEDMIKIERHA